MYSSLLPQEKKYLLDQLDIILDIDDYSSNIKKVTDFTIKIKQSIIYEESVLEGKFIQYRDFLVVQNFKPVKYSLLCNYIPLFEVICYEAISKLKKFAKLYSHYDLRIFSTDDIIIDQLFEHKAVLEKIDCIGVIETMARFKI